MKDSTFKTLAYVATALGLALLVSTCSEMNEEPSEGKNVSKQNQIEASYPEVKKIFAPGEHVISVPFEKDPTKTRLQYPYYEGYSAIGLSSSSYGGFYMFRGASILYVNNVEVVCNQTNTDENGNVVFSEFGIPTGDVQKINQNLTETTKDFGVGEHIISVPVKIDPTESNVQYIFGSSDCYEVVDISATSYGRTYIFRGSCLLYVNKVPVRCTSTSQDENGNNVYCDFGTPLTQDNIKVLK